MTLAEIEKEVRRIEDAKGDPEVQHGIEDDVRVRVLVAIAQGATNARELAEAVLKTSDLDFPRWCA